MPSINKIRYGGIDYDILGEELASVESMRIVTDASGDIAVISDGADDVAVKSLVAEITPVQSGSGDPSPTNIRPISGRTGMAVTRAGKNLLPPTGTGITINGITYTANGDGSITINGTAIGSAVMYLANTFDANGSFSVKTWTLSADLSAISGQAIIQATVYNPITQQVVSRPQVTPSVPSVTFTVLEGKTLLNVFIRISDGAVASNVTIFPQLELGSTATPYEPCHGATYPVTWEIEAGTVYGGTLDVVSGVLTVTDAQIASYAGETLPGEWISDRDVYAAGTTPTTGAQVVYKLATPQTYQLTPTEVRTLLGGNNIYTDAGAVSVEYVADTKLYIDKKIAELQALILEN